MLKRIFGCLFFIFMIVALVIHFTYGYSSIPLENSKVWLNNVSHHFAYFKDWKIPTIPKIVVPNLSETSWWEYVPVMLAAIVNGFISVLNAVISVQNIVDDLIFLIVSIVWVMVDSVPILVTGNG